MPPGAGGSGGAATAPWGKGNCMKSVCGMVWSSAVRIPINGIGGIPELIATSSPFDLWGALPGLPIPDAGGYGLLSASDFLMLSMCYKSRRFILNIINY